MKLRKLMCSIGLSLLAALSVPQTCPSGIVYYCGPCLKLSHPSFTCCATPVDSSGNYYGNWCCEYTCTEVDCMAGTIRCGGGIEKSLTSGPNYPYVCYNNICVYNP